MAEDIMDCIVFGAAVLILVLVFWGGLRSECEGRYRPEGRTMGGRHDD